MEEGILGRHKEEIADYLVNYGYEPFNVHPVALVPTGPCLYGLDGPNEPLHYVGIHMMDTNDCLEHPDWRPRVQVIKNRFNLTDGDITEVPAGVKGGDIQLDTFELWKFVTLYTRGSAVAYELLYMPTVHCDPGAESLFGMMREGATNRIGKTARDYAIHVWRKDRTNRKKTVMTYYRLMQAVCFLKEEDFQWDTHLLLEYMGGIPRLTSAGTTVINLYNEPEHRESPVSKLLQTTVSEEISGLIDEVDRAGISTKLPDQVPPKILLAIREKIKQTRSRML